MFYKIVKAILLPFLYLLYRPEVTGRENIPEKGSVIIYSNHVSLLDPVVIGCMMRRRVYFMAKQELFRSRLFAFILNKLGAFPVKRGTADISAIKKSLQILKEGKVFGIFPEGTRSKTGYLQEFSHGIASIAHKSKAVTIPVIISNEYKLFRPVKIKIGKPLLFEHYYRQHTNTELLENMSNEMLSALRDIINE